MCKPTDNQRVYPPPHMGRVTNCRLIVCTVLSMVVYDKYVAKVIKKDTHFIAIVKKGIFLTFAPTFLLL